jgi:hypothetical protein
MLPSLIADALRVGVPVSAVRTPLAEGPVIEGKRLPHLAALGDREERISARNLAGRTMETAHNLGIRLFPITFGRVSLTTKEPLIRAHFARRELDEDEPGHRALGEALAERRSQSPALLDACRSSLERLVKVAERLDVRLAILMAANPWQVPSPRETLDLLDEFRGAPIGVVWSPARLAVLTGLGLDISDERRTSLRGRAFLIDASDRCGLEYPLLPKLGELPLDDLATTSEVPTVLSGRPDSREDEVTAARAFVDDQLRKSQENTSVARGDAHGEG